MWIASQKGGYPGPMRQPGAADVTVAFTHGCCIDGAGDNTASMDYNVNARSDAPGFIPLSYSSLSPLIADLSNGQKISTPECQKSRLMVQPYDAPNISNNSNKDVVGDTASIGNACTIIQATGSTYTNVSSDRAVEVAWPSSSAGLNANKPNDESNSTVPMKALLSTEEGSLTTKTLQASTVSLHSVCTA